jgi:predicted GNAT superfamily acetyltransferase
MTSQPLNQFRLSYESRENYLYVFVNGKEVSKEIAISFYDEILSKAEELGYTKVLIEEDFPNQINIADLFEVADFIANKSRGKVQLAHVDRQEKDLELNQFAETVAVNRGFRGKVFASFNEAERWLLGE